jgi:hypothetical protein
MTLYFRKQGERVLKSYGTNEWRRSLVGSPREVVRAVADVKRRPDLAPAATEQSEFDPTELPSFALWPDAHRRGRGTEGGQLVYQVGLAAARATRASTTRVKSSRRRSMALASAAVIVSAIWLCMNRSISSSHSRE